MLQVHCQLAGNPQCILTDVMSLLSGYVHVPCQNGQLSFYGKQSKTAAHLCHHKFLSISPSNFNSLGIAAKGKENRMASLLLSSQEPTTHFRKGSEQSEDSNNAHLKHNGCFKRQKAEVRKKSQRTEIKRN